MLFFSDKRIRSLVRLLAILLSSVLPILSIVVLYSVKEDKVRLGLIVMFSALCSTAPATLSNTKNVEVITATAAYVFFVSLKFIKGWISITYLKPVSANYGQLRCGSSRLREWQPCFKHFDLPTPDSD